MDAIFFLKTPADDRSLRALDWPDTVKRIGLEPPRGYVGAGGDWRTSTAYGALLASLGGADQAVAALRRRHGIDGRVAFVSYSAGFGFVDALLRSSTARADIDAVFSIDSAFGGLKEGYAAYGARAARGAALLVATSANTGGDASWAPTWSRAAELAGQPSLPASPRAALPDPSGGVFRLGTAAWWYRFVDAGGDSELPHWEQHQLVAPLLGAYLLPRWSGASAWWVGVGILSGAALWAGWALGRRRLSR